VAGVAHDQNYRWVKALCYSIAHARYVGRQIATLYAKASIVSLLKPPPHEAMQYRFRALEEVSVEGPAPPDHLGASRP